ncbi:hypothetical protein [Embleya scabrispora]|uniref:hypothetical protein n=1 Tax=Embleya scabrispora TaxID=159449 RepID=UPI0003A6AD6C|nr:hypothetical protein [Embleya scabrispora]MYS84706.1 hypothetical protein [Streptomyces sp. SID5474]
MTWGTTPDARSSDDDPELARMIRMAVIVRRVLLLGSAGAAFAVWRLVEPNPWNLDVLDEGILSSRPVLATLGWCLIATEIVATSRSFLLRVCALALAILSGVMVGFILVAYAVLASLVPSGRSTEEVVAVSPDGRIRAVRLDYDDGDVRHARYGLEIRMEKGLDRSTRILDGCHRDRGTIANTRFIGNRALEYDPPQGPPVRVRFDRNVKAERRICP